MDFKINHQELDALSGLPHIQRLAYLMGIRPYMDGKTGLVGIKRRISHQSISEQLYVEPHQGIKSQNFSRDQVRRALYGLVRAGVITIQSEGMQLILKCELATMHYSVQKKAAINPPQKATINPHDVSLVETGLSHVDSQKGDIAESSKAAIPLKEDNYFVLLSQFEKFWSLYPEKKSKAKAQAAFEQLNPSALVFQQLMSALQNQIHHVETMKLNGTWVAHWKYPANWLAHRCWEDEITEMKQESHHETHWKPHQHQSTRDPFWNPSEEDHEPERTNIVHFPRG
ncbi:hypothetical protein DGG96_17420 [Legionella qingyii]|uniref:Vir protein n=1 Tax=Legionella qingyii TaxID=2184757 RepID=A0A317U1R6_9GAMM|nr:hypothetical protein [Legionella qingyii]PWY54320.1 hypothetical protein DGG96_17420 [Legionella qingyii]RUR24136.1 hypothetical protein ELY20_06130 [Legionella qingyii]